MSYTVVLAFRNSQNAKFFFNNPNNQALQPEISTVTDGYNPPQPNLGLYPTQPSGQITPNSFITIYPNTIAQIPQGYTPIYVYNNTDKYVVSTGPGVDPLKFTVKGGATGDQYLIYQGVPPQNVTDQTPPPGPIDFQPIYYDPTLFTPQPLSQVPSIEVTPPGEVPEINYNPYLLTPQPLIDIPPSDYVPLKMPPPGIKDPRVIPVSYPEQITPEGQDSLNPQPSQYFNPNLSDPFVQQYWEPFSPPDLMQFPWELTSPPDLMEIPYQPPSEMYIPDPPPVPMPTPESPFIDAPEIKIYPSDLPDWMQQPIDLDQPMIIDPKTYYDPRQTTQISYPGQGGGKSGISSIFVGLLAAQQDGNGNDIGNSQIVWSVDGLSWNAGNNAAGNFLNLEAISAGIVYFNGIWTVSQRYTYAVDSFGTALHTNMVVYSYDGKNWLIGMIPNRPDLNSNVTQTTDTVNNRLILSNPNNATAYLYCKVPATPTLVADTALSSPKDDPSQPATGAFGYLLNSLVGGATAVRFNANNSRTFDITYTQITTAIVNSGATWPAATWYSTLNTTPNNQTLSTIAYGPPSPGGNIGISFA